MEGPPVVLGKKQISSFISVEREIFETNMEGINLRKQAISIIKGNCAKKF